MVLNSHKQNKVIMVKVQQEKIIWPKIVMKKIKHNNWKSHVKLMCP